MAFIHFSEIPSGEVTGATFSCEPSLIDRCLPSLHVLDQYNINSMSMLYRIQDGNETDYAIMRPRFFDAVRIPKKCRDDVSSAVSRLWVVISAAIEAAIADNAEDDDVPSSFFAYVTVEHDVRSFGWSIRCEVVATVADDHPNLAIRLR
jgi:hypothetical protein